MQHQGTSKHPQMGRWDQVHTVKFLGLSQKKMYNEFYAGNHLV